MAGEKKKKKKPKGSKNGKNGESNKKVSNKPKKVKRGKSKGSRISADIFTEAAMENAYVTCHNVQDLLRCRGFPWPDAQKKKKSKRR